MRQKMAQSLKPLFNTPEAIRALENTSEFLRSKEQNKKASQLGSILWIISKNAEEFDKNCQLNIGWIGTYTLNAIKEIRTSFNNESVDALTAAIYRFIVEYDMSIKNDLSMEVRSFISSVVDNLETFSGNERRQIEFAQREMPIGIVKHIINSEEFGSLRNLTQIGQSIDQKINDWKLHLDATENKANSLGDLLKIQAQAFNFVGLHKGFSDLSDGIKRELKIARIGMGLFGFLVLVPGFMDVLLILTKGFDLSKSSLQNVVAVTLAVVSITLLFLYFFRLALRKADSCRAQLLQVQLRMSLCRFIQSYADYSNEIRAKNSDALAKFESIIFSGIVSSDDKLPSTFDGIEQLAAFAKSVTGK
jgi:hypothetical protein